MKKPNDNLQVLFRDMNKVLVENRKEETTQEEQVELLMKLEIRLRNAFWRWPKQTREIYKSFILMTLVDRRNVLTARPYFRERTAIFSKKITQTFTFGLLVPILRHLSGNHVNSAYTVSIYYAKGEIVL